MANTKKNITKKKIEAAVNAVSVEHLEKTVSRMRSEAESSERANLQVNGMRMAMYDSLMLEKMDLMGRIGRIGQRIHMLGLQPAPEINVSLDLTKTPGVSR